MTRDIKFRSVIIRSIRPYANVFTVGHAIKLCHLFYIKLPLILTKPYIPLIRNIGKCSRINY